MAVAWVGICSADYICCLVWGYNSVYWVCIVGCYSMVGTLGVVWDIVGIACVVESMMRILT